MGEMVRTHVLLPRELVERIDERVGPRRRSEFVAETLRKELDRNRLLELALAASEETRRLGPAAGPPEWATSDGAAAWVRKQRGHCDESTGAPPEG
jgi:Arc/MetJ-type ribon-helix-helix transcriptional regulator